MNKNTATHSSSPKQHGCGKVQNNARIRLRMSCDRDLCVTTGPVLAIVEEHGEDLFLASATVFVDWNGEKKDRKKRTSEAHNYILHPNKKAERRSDSVQDRHFPY